jgi:hypothetical protein
MSCGPAAHLGPRRNGATRAQRPRGLAGRAGEGEQGRARAGDGSPRWIPRRRGDAMGLDTATVVAS